MIQRKKSTSDEPSQTIATIISRVVDPPVVLTFLTIVGVTISDISRRGIAVLFVLLPFFIGVPLGFFFWLLKTHRIHTIDVTNRKERVRPLAGLLFFLFLDILVISLFDNPFLLNMFLLYFIWTLGFLLITLFWKISGHIGIATLAVGLLMYWFGVQLFPLFCIVPVVAWARLTRHDHTVAQVLAGFGYSLGILAIWKYWVY